MKGKKRPGAKLFCAEIISCLLRCWHSLTWCIVTLFLDAAKQHNLTHFKKRKKKRRRRRKRIREKIKRHLFESALSLLFNDVFHFNCWLFSDFISQPTRLNVHKNDSETWDYTTPTPGSGISISFTVSFCDRFYLFVDVIEWTNF